MANTRHITYAAYTQQKKGQDGISFFDMAMLA